jgi:Zn-dependent protease with chaperone function
MNIVATSRTGKETVYGVLMYVFGVLGWLAIGAAIFAWVRSEDPKMSATFAIYAVYGGLFVAYRWLAPLFYRAYSYGNMIRLSPQQFPELHAMVAEGAQKLGFSKVPTAFLYNSNGLLNAFAMRAFGGRYVYLTSALVEANDDAQVKFVVGHELGHHAAGHLNPVLNFLKFPAHVVPFLSQAYSRGRESTCDAIGFRLSRDAHAAQSALAMLGCGCRRMNAGLNCDAFAAQEAEVPALFGFLGEIFRSHPRLTRRVQAIRKLAALPPAEIRAEAADPNEPRLDFGVSRA